VWRPRVSPLKEAVEEAMATAPVSVCPAGPTEVTPVLVMVRPEPSVYPVPVTLMPVPFDIEDVATVWSAPVPLPYTTCAAPKEAAPVPPCATPRTPVVLASAMLRDD